MSASIQVALEAVTPLFLAGANPRGTPELRPPPFRGAMRYWLRALIGAAGEQVMRQHEDYLFGVVGNQSTAGAVSLRLSVSQTLQTQCYSQLVNQSPSISYLWFAARGTKREPERHAIFPINFNFELFFPRSKQPQQDLEQTASVLWLLTRLGGVGARSRRFAGGLQVAKVKSSDGKGLIGQLPVCAQSPEKLVEEITHGIKEARRAFNITLVSPAPDQFDVLHPDCCQIFVLNTVFPSWEEAVGKIGEIYQKFRKLRQPDYDVVKTAMSSVSNLQGTVDRAAFGLPVPFFYRSLNNRTATLQAKEQGEDDIDRRSSPLWMRVVKLSNGQYTVVFTWFKSQFLPTGAKLLLRKRSQKDLLSQQLPNDQLITVFLTGNDPKNRSLKDAGYDLLEVPLQ